MRHAPAATPAGSGMRFQAGLIPPLDRWLALRHPVTITVWALLLALGLGVLDLETGYELSFSIFYLAPVALVSWYAGRWSSLLLCAVSAWIWIFAEVGGGQSYSHQSIPIWNTLVRFAFFVTLSWLLRSLRTQLSVERRLSRTDSLTGALNSRAFTESLVRTGRLAGRTRSPLALAYLDLDNFKQVNDQHGHSEGDKVLRTAAQVVGSRLRATDSFGRVGGDEFAILMPATSASGAQSLMDDVDQAFRSAMAVGNWPVGFSIGVAVFQPPPPNADDMIRQADELMYRVKRAGKGNVLVESFATTGPQE